MPDCNPCPYCGQPMPDDTVGTEVRHMTEQHPDIVEARLTKAGFVRIDGELVDTLASDD